MMETNILLLLVSILSSLHSVSALLYYVSSDPIANKTCIVNGSIALTPCYSFDQLTIDKALLSNKTRVTFLLLSSNYNISHIFAAHNLGVLDILPWNEHEKVAIKCQLSDELVFHNVGKLRVSSLIFISCTLRFIPFVYQITTENCIFIETSAIIIEVNYVDNDINISINKSTFSLNNRAISIIANDGGYIGPIWNIYLVITDSEFLNNLDGSLYIKNARTKIYRSQFINNSATASGGAIVHREGVLTIYDCEFKNNSARTGHGGAIDSVSTNPLVVYHSTFQRNFATASGGAISAEVVKCIRCHFENNSAGESGGALFLYKGRDYGSIYTLEEATSFSVSIFNFNQARLHGGAVYCEKYPRNARSLIFHKSNSKINSATKGGFLYLSGCHVTLNDNISILYNHAERGGAIYTEHSNITIQTSDQITIANNVATSEGGALFLADSILELSIGLLILENNTAADKGGAIYVSDNKCETMSNSSSCFVDIQFSILVVLHNHAKNGSALYGGLLDRCYLHTGPEMSYSKLSSIDKFKQVLSTYSQPASSAIASIVVRVCLCVNDKPDCSRRDLHVTKLRGQIVNPIVTTVDQVETSATSSIMAHYTEVPAKLGEGEGRQLVYDYCTNMSYHIYTEADSATLVLQPEGYCERSPLSTIKIHIRLQNCTTGFEQFKDRCVCDRRLLKYLSNVTCSIESFSISRKGSTWFSYSEEHLKMHANCPLDHCLVSSDAVSLTSPDEQCANHRSGVICGECQENHSIALGSSKCIHCTSKYTFIWLTALFAVAGVALVALLLVCNMTISSGTLNGLIFYANVVSISGLTSLQNCSIHPILSVFIAWLNLDFGVETCFYPGMNTYQKTWLQFAFPLYIFLLVAAILVASYYSSTAMKVFGRNNIAILATLFLLSYSKILKTIITALNSTQVLVSSADNVSDQIVPERVWTYDGNIEYLKGKHVALFTVALLLLLFLFLPYTLLLTFGQCIRSMSVRKRWVSQVIRSTVFVSIMDAYHAPYKRRHRYWTGFMLLMRCVLFLAIASFNRDSGISTNMYITTLVIITILIVKILATKIYNHLYLDLLELWFHLNLLVLSSTLCYLLTNSTSSDSVLCKCTSASFSIIFITFFGILSYHAYLQLQKTRYFVHFRHTWRAKCQHAARIKEHTLVPADTGTMTPTTTMVDLREELLASDANKSKN